MIGSVHVRRKLHVCAKLHARAHVSLRYRLAATRICLDSDHGGSSLHMFLKNSVDLVGETGYNENMLLRPTS